MQTLAPLDMWIEEKDARERAEQRVSDFKTIALNWCTRAGESTAMRPATAARSCSPRSFRQS